VLPDDLARSGRSKTRDPKPKTTGLQSKIQNPKSKILPAWLRNAGDITRQRQLPEAKPAQIELAKVPARAPAPPAPVAVTDL